MWTCDNCGNVTNADNEDSCVYCDNRRNDSIPDDSTSKENYPRDTSLGTTGSISSFDWRATPKPIDKSSLSEGRKKIFYQDNPLDELSKSAEKAQAAIHDSKSIPFPLSPENHLIQELTSLGIDEEVCKALLDMNLLDIEGLKYIIDLEAKEIADMLNVTVGKVIPAKFKDRVDLFLKGIKSVEGMAVREIDSDIDWMEPVYIKSDALPVQTPYWACKICTVHNPIEMKSCMMCFFAREHLSVWQLKDEDMRANNDTIFARALQGEEDGKRKMQDIFNRDVDIAKRFESDLEAGRLQAERLAQEERRLAEDAELARQIAEAGIFRCIVCMEDVYTEDVFDLDHGNHKICRDCATVYLNNALKDKSVPIKCPFDRCTHIISEPKCFEVLGEELYDEFFDLSCRPHGDPGFRQCPVLNCKGFDLLDDVNTGDCYCFICERHWCCNCHVDLEQSQHKNISCQKYQELKRKNDTGDKAIEDFLRQGINDLEGEFRMRRCPKCRMAFMKDKACIHAVCLPLGGGCGTHFCFRCAKYSADDATSIYRHQGTCLGTSYKTLRNFEKINLDDFNVSDQIFPLHRIRDTRKPPPKASRPPWVSIVFASASSESSSKSMACDFRVIDTKDTIDDRSLAILESSVPYRRILLEFDAKELLQAMSANFIFIQLPDKSPRFFDAAIQQLQDKLNSPEFTSKTGQCELWIEPCPFFEGFGALHFSTVTIEFFHSILRAAGELKFKPFPDYCMLGLSNCTRLDQWKWNNYSLTSPYGIQVPPHQVEVPSINGRSKIKVGVIERGYYNDDDVPNAFFHPELNMLNASSEQCIHGTHVAGIIGATAISTTVLDHMELHLYSLISFEIDPNSSLPPQILHWFSFLQPSPFVNEIFHCFEQCKRDKVSLVNISMEWFYTFQKQYIENTLDAVRGIMESDSWDCHFIISAGNFNRYLDSYQTNQPGQPEHRIKVDFFSALTKLLPDRISLISASDVFGHHCSFSNYGSMVALAAPGEEILSTSGGLEFDTAITANEKIYDFRTGTSQSAPLVTAAIAVMKLRFPDMSNIEIIDRFKATADIHFTLLGKCSASGRLNLGRAIGLPGSVICEDKWRAYSARSKALVTYDEKIFEIMDSMTVVELIEWYDRLPDDYSDGHGKRVLNAVSCAHLFKAIDPFRAIEVEDQERLRQRNLIVARIRSLAGQEQHLSIQQRLEDVACQFDQQATQPPIALSDWLRGLAERLYLDPSQALSEWRHPYPLPPFQPMLQDNQLLSDVLNQLANRISTVTEFLPDLVVPPVEDNEQLQELIVRHAPPDLQARLSEWLREANETIALEQAPDVHWELYENHHDLLRNFYNVTLPAPCSMEWLSQLSVMLNQLARHGAPIEQEEQNSLSQEWLQLLQLQLEKPFPTAFLRDMALRRVTRLEPLRQLMYFFSERSHYNAVDGLLNFWAPLAKDVILLLRRALLESEAAIAQLNNPPAMLPIWENEKKCLVHHIAVWESKLAKCGV